MDLCAIEFSCLRPNDSMLEYSMEEFFLAGDSSLNHRPTGSRLEGEIA
jgi:hypothetical protein